MLRDLLLYSIYVHKNRHFIDGKDCFFWQSFDRFYPRLLQWTILVANDVILVAEDELFLDVF